MFISKIPPPDFSRLREHTLYGIMGSDVFLKFVIEKRVPRTKVNEWYIIPRDRDALDLSQVCYNWFKKVTILDSELFHKQGSSSTEIRKAICDGNTSELPLIEKNITYIQRHKLYIE